MVLTRSSFEDLTVVELIQNICCYMDHKREKNFWFEFDIFDKYIRWNFEFLWLKWLKFSPYIMYVYNKLGQDDPFFYPGVPSNEIPFYNRLIHYGKKEQKKKRGKIMHVNSF